MAKSAEVLWRPSPKRVANANITRYRAWLDERGTAFRSYDELWAWSTTELARFWESIWEFFDVPGRRGVGEALAASAMPGAKWFAGGEVNYAERALSGAAEATALIVSDEGGEVGTVTYGELRARVASVQANLTELGIGRGDRVASLLPNRVEQVVAFLATAGLGAIWAACAPELGARGVLSRLRQIQPRVLFAADGYRHEGRAYPRLSNLEAIRRSLPCLERTVVVRLLELEPPSDTLTWEQFSSGDAGLPRFERLPFDHPLWILYSSGTTGAPKAIVHGHGGILLEQLKAHSLHLDLRAGDRFFWYTSPAWVAWNLLISALLVDAVPVLYDGAPAHRGMGHLWQLAERARVSAFASSPGFYAACANHGERPGAVHGLASLRTLISSGAELAEDQARWLYDAVKRDVLLANVSGGTDICTPLVGALPTRPVRAGEIQCRMLGASVESWDAGGRATIGERGELVVTRPMPSMPLFMWNDAGGERYRNAYFSRFSGVWHHGDWITITARGTCLLHGRSDATLNRGGIRMGSSDFYDVVERLDAVEDSLVVGARMAGEEEILLFVVLGRDSHLDARLRRTICERLAADASPRHVPDEIIAVPEIPRTLTGAKKPEIPVKRLLEGARADSAVGSDALGNPDSLAPFIEFAEQRRSAPRGDRPGACAAARRPRGSPGDGGRSAGD